MLKVCKNLSKANEICKMLCFKISFLKLYQNIWKSNDICEMLYCRISLLIKVCQDLSTGNEIYGMLCLISYSFKIHIWYKMLHVEKLCCFKLIVGSFVFILDCSYDERVIILQPSQRGGIILVKIRASKDFIMKI